MEEKNIMGLKTLFVPAKVKELDIYPVLKKFKLKKRKIGLVSSVQYLDYLKEVKEYLEKQDNRVFIGGQVIGCNLMNIRKIKEKINTFVFFGSGEFHPLELIDKTDITEIYLINPVSGYITKFKEEEIINLKKRRKGRLKKYLMADKIGVLVSTKPGQEALKSAMNFVKKCKKDAYLFITNEIDVDKLEDFNDIQMWVNSSCPRIEGKNIISLREIIDSEVMN